MNNKNVAERMAEAAPGLNLIEIRAYRPGQDVRVVTPETLREWNPALGLSYEDAAGKIHTLIGWAYELIFEQSRIARL